MSYLLSAMLDSTNTPFLSLADDTIDSKNSSRYSAVNKSLASSKKSTSSFASAYDDTRVERLEREVTGLTRKLDKLQEILTQSGIKLPSDI